MAIPEVEDWTQLIQLMGQYAGTPTLVAVDADGNIIAVMKGDHAGTLTTLAVDGSGRLISIIRDPTSDNYIAVDAAGFLTAVLKGIEGVNLRTVAVDASGHIINVIRDPTSDNYVAVDTSGFITAVLKGIEGVNLRTVAVDASGRIINVIRDPTSDNYVAVDANGFITAVLKGLYDTTLKTLATDADGRLIAILTDPEDVWGTFRQMGLAGLAAVISPAKRFDFRGDVVWYSDFENGLQGAVVGVDHADSTYEITTNRAYHGGFSLKLDPRGAADAYVEWMKILAMTTPKKIGLSTAVSIDTDPDTLKWTMFFRDGTNRHYGLLEYDPSNGNWRVLDDNLDWQAALSGYYLQQGAGAWHTVKLVVDFENDLYHRLLVDDQEADLSSIGLRVSASASLARVEMRFKVEGSVASSEAGFLDTVVITQNEPA